MVKWGDLWGEGESSTEMEICTVLQAINSLLLIAMLLE